MKPLKLGLTFALWSIGLVYTLTAVRLSYKPLIIISGAILAISCYALGIHFGDKE